MSNAYVIEIAGTAAGIVVADEGGFRFYASIQPFSGLEGLIFRHPRDAEKAARQLIARRGPRGRPKAL